MLNINMDAFPPYCSFAQIWGFFIFGFDHMHLFILFTCIALMSDVSKGFRDLFIIYLLNRKGVGVSG